MMIWRKLVFLLGLCMVLAVAISFLLGNVLTNGEAIIIIIGFVVMLLSFAKGKDKKG